MASACCFWMRMGDLHSSMFTPAAVRNTGIAMKGLEDFLPSSPFLLSASSYEFHSFCAVEQCINLAV